MESLIITEHCRVVAMVINILCVMLLWELTMHLNEHYNSQMWNDNDAKGNVIIKQLAMNKKNPQQYVMVICIMHEVQNKKHIKPTICFHVNKQWYTKWTGNNMDYVVNKLSRRICCLSYTICECVHANLAKSELDNISALAYCVNRLTDQGT
jgi:hypothetical protein